MSDQIWWRGVRLSEARVEAEVRANTTVRIAGGELVAAPARLEIDRINFTNGRLVVADLSVTPPYKATITGSGAVSSLVNRAGKAAEISVNGLLAGEAPLSLSGEFGLFTPEPLVDYQLTAQPVNRGGNHVGTGSGD